MGRIFGRRDAGAARDAAARARAKELSERAKDLVASKQYVAAIPVLRESIAGLRLLAGGGRGPRRLVGIELSYLSVCLLETGAMREALAAAEESLPVLEGMGTADSLVMQSLAVVARSLHSLSERPEDKIAAARRAAEIGGRLGRPVRRLRMLNLLAASLSDSGRKREALEVQKEAITVLAAVAEITDVPRWQSVQEHVNLALLEVAVGDFDDACAAVEVCAAGMAGTDFSAGPKTWRSIAANLAHLGRMLAENGHRGPGREAYELALTAFHWLRAEAPELFVPNSYALFLNNHAWNLCALDEPAAALSFVQEAIDVARAHGEPTPAQRRMYVVFLDTLAVALALLGRRDEAVAACSEAIGILRELVDLDADFSADPIAVIDVSPRDALPKVEALLARIQGIETGSLFDR